MIVSVIIAGSLAISQPAIKPCFVNGHNRNAECVTLKVPKDYAVKGDQWVDLDVIRVKAASPSNLPPLFVLAGGPGQAATDMTHTLKSSFKEIAKQHDVIFVAQRGSGPNYGIRCGSSDSVVESELNKQLIKCREQVKDKFSELTTKVLTDDIEFVRQSFGYSKINLWGGSYGTFAAQFYAVEYPQFTNGLILDAVVALDANPLVDGGIYPQQALERVVKICDESEVCSNQFGDWDKKFYDLIEVSENGNLEFESEEGKVKLGKTELTHLVRTSLYSPSLSSYLPLAISKAYEGDMRIFSSLNKMISSSAIDTMYLGLTIGVLCQEHVYQGQSEEAADAGKESFVQDSYYQFWKDICGGERAEQAAFLQREIKIDVPTLLISGELDPITPEQSAEKAKRYLSNATHIVIPNAGHTNSHLGCMPKLTSEFLKTENVSDPSCITNNRFPVFAN